MSITTTEGALRAMGVTEDALGTTQRRHLVDEGYFIVPGYFSAEQVGALRIAADKAAETASVPSHQDHRATLTPSLWRRATPAMRYLLDIEGATLQAADYG